MKKLIHIALWLEVTKREPYKAEFKTYRKELTIISETAANIMVKFDPSDSRTTRVPQSGVLMPISSFNNDHNAIRYKIKFRPEDEKEARQKLFVAVTENLK